MDSSLDQIVAQLAQQVDTSKKVALAGGKTSSFCDYWPIARPVLETLKQFFPSLAWLLSLLIAAGDKLCPPKP